MGVYCDQYEEHKILLEKTLMMGGSQSIDPDSYHGDLSSIIIRNLPFGQRLEEHQIETSINERL